MKTNKPKASKTGSNVQVKDLKPKKNAKGGLSRVSKIEALAIKQKVSE